jgi:hypothetical protein
MGDDSVYVRVGVGNPVDLQRGAKTFIGAYDGSDQPKFYAGAAAGWVDEERFIELHRHSPANYCRLHYDFLEMHAGQEIICNERAFPNPHPGRRTFLGFAPIVVEERLLGYAVHTNLGSGGELVDVTLGSPGMQSGSRLVPLRPFVHPHSDPPFARPILGFLVFSRPVTLAVQDDGAVPDLGEGLETFVGAYDGVRHYYAGQGRQRGWVTRARFDAIHGQHPADYCRTHYGPLLDAAGGVAIISNNQVPDPFPGQPTYLGVMPRRHGGLLTVHLNAGKARSNEVRPAGFQVQDATARSPSLGRRHWRLDRAVEACGPPIPDLEEGCVCVLLEVVGA